jgi:ABC-type glycerol-3-phosphate transport system substrate-binding protein
MLNKSAAICDRWREEESMTRRTTRLVIAVLIALGIAVAGCSTSGSSLSAASGHATTTVWEWGSPGATIKTLTTDFERSPPKIKVNLVVQPFNSYFTLLRTAVASHKGPDVVEIYASPYVFDYYQGFLNLTRYVTADQRKDLLGWNLVSTGLSNSGTPYALPWSGQGILFYYNKKYFREAGLNPNEPPTTWAEFLSDCAPLKSRHHSDHCPNVVNNFAGGKGAMFVGLAANNANWSQFKPTLGNNLGDFLEPALPGSRYPHGNWFDYDPGLAWSITKWSAYSEQDYQYISYLAQPSSQSQAFPIDGTLPNTKLSTSTSSYAPAQAILGWVRNAVTYPGLDDLMRSDPKRPTTRSSRRW